MLNAGLDYCNGLQLPVRPKRAGRPRVSRKTAELGGDEDVLSDLISGVSIKLGRAILLVFQPAIGDR